MLEKNKVVINTLYHFHSLLIITWTMIYLLKSFFPLDPLKGKILSLSLTMHAVELTEISFTWLVSIAF